VNIFNSQLANSKNDLQLYPFTCSEKKTEQLVIFSLFKKKLLQRIQHCRVGAGANEVENSLLPRAEAALK
jgi:hypothetical protein